MAEAALARGDAPDQRPVRLVVVQGPMQTLVACAAVRHSDSRWGGGHRNVMLLGGVLADDDIAHYAVVREAVLDCAVAVEWDQVLEMADVPDGDRLREAVASSGEVREVVCCRNWQSVNELALAAFPEARRVVVGDGLGVIDVDRDPSRPQFHLALPVIPIPLTQDSLGATELEVVPRQALLDVISAMRAHCPKLRQVDEELARFAQGGVLLLINYLTEAYDSTLRGEIELAHRVARAASPWPGAPIVVKPHPRSSLGQAAALARRLRSEGHLVRIMGERDCGHYPIELFERLVNAVDDVRAQGSSSGLSIVYLHGVRPDVGLPWGAGRQVLPRQRKALLRAPVHLGYYADLLGTWDGRSALPSPPAGWTPSLSDRVLGRLTRPIMWAPAPCWRERTRPWKLPRIPTVVLRHLGDDHPHVVTDRRAGVAWLLNRSDSHLIRVDPGSNAPDARILETLNALSRAAGVNIGLAAAVVPSSHAPGWLRWWRLLVGVRLVEDARMSAEECEDLLETKTDVLVRVPEVGLSVAQAARRLAHGQPSRTIGAGFVIFACRTRHASEPQAKGPTVV